MAETSRRSAKSLAPLLGRDLRLEYALSGGFFEDADLASRVDAPGQGPTRDLRTVDGVDTLAQAIVNRLKTRKGELTALGHPTYGSRHHELLGEPNVERTRNLIKLYILQALRDEPRIERVVKATVRPEHSPPRETVRIELQLRLIDVPTPLNLIVPFSLEGSL